MLSSCAMQDMICALQLRDDLGSFRSSRQAADRGLDIRNALTHLSGAINFPMLGTSHPGDSTMARAKSVVALWAALRTRQDPYSVPRRYSMRRTLSLLVVVTALAGAVQAAPATQIGVVLAGSSLDFWAPMSKGMHRAADDLHVELVMRSPSDGMSLGARAAARRSNSDFDRSSYGIRRSEQHGLQRDFHSKHRQFRGR